MSIESSTTQSTETIIKEAPSYTGILSSAGERATLAGTLAGSAAYLIPGGKVAAGVKVASIAQNMIATGTQMGVGLFGSGVNAATVIKGSMSAAQAAARGYSYGAQIAYLTGSIIAANPVTAAAVIGVAVGVTIYAYYHFNPITVEVHTNTSSHTENTKEVEVEVPGPTQHKMHLANEDR
jgi:hypothetical protein